MKSINDYADNKITLLFEDLGAFWAYNETQRAEEQKPGVEYVSIQGFNGLFVPKENANKLRDGIFEIYGQAQRDRLNEYGIEAIIRYEIANHECWYQGDISDAMNALSFYDVTEEQVWKVYHEHKAEWLELNGY